MNQEKIDIALSKLTEEEKELLGLIKKPKKPKVKKNHKLKLFYMIGDADGWFNKENTISINNPFLEIVTAALDKLEICEGSCGLQLNEEDYLGNFENNKINELEYDLLCLVSCYSLYDKTSDDFLQKHNFENTKENHQYLNEFVGLLIEENEWSYLVFEDYKLK